MNKEQMGQIENNLWDGRFKLSNIDITLNIMIWTLELVAIDCQIV